MSVRRIDWVDDGVYGKVEWLGVDTTTYRTTPLGTDSGAMVGWGKVGHHDGDRDQPVEPEKPKPIDFETLEWGTWIAGTHWHDAESMCGRFIGVSTASTIRLMLPDDEIAYIDPKSATVLRPDEVPG